MSIDIYRNRNFLLASGATLLLFMVVAMITPAFPRMVRDMGISSHSIGLLVTVAALPCIILAPFVGIIAHKYGRKNVFVISLFLFGIAGGSIALTSNFYIILILRLLQGIGSVALFSIGISIIGDTFVSQKRAEAMGLNNTINYTGYIIYPLIGGALADIDWHYTFLPYYIAVPFAILTLVYLHDSKKVNQQTFMQYMRHGLDYFKRYDTLWLFLTVFVTYVLLFGAVLTYFSLLMGERFHVSPVVIGIFVAIIGLISSGTSSQLGFLTRRYSVIFLLISAFVMYALSMFIIPSVWNIWFMILPVVLFGIAHGINIPSLNITATSIAPSEYRVGFMSIFNMVVNLGITLGPLIMGLVYTVADISFTFIIAGILALMVLFLIIVGRKRLHLD